MQTLTIDNLEITIAGISTDRICYLLYPFAPPKTRIEERAKQFAVTIAAISGMDWDNDLTPWKAKGVPTGSAEFQGLAPEFLSTLKDRVMPQIESRVHLSPTVERTLAGVSLSGLFTLWQWMQSDLFENIISLSGSFWYEGFVDWIKSVRVPVKKGRAYFLLGNKEAQSPVPQFRDVQTNTVEIVNYLSAHGIKDFFELVPGNHYQYGEQRLDRAFAWMFGTTADKSR